MKEKKRWLAIVMALSIFAMLALGSGSSGSGETKDIVTDGGSSSSDSSADAEAEETEESTAETAIAADVTIEEQVLVEQDGIKITSTEYTTDSIWGDGIKLLLENDTEQNVHISCSALIVNNYMITDLFSETVAAGKKSNETLYLSSSELKAAGIDTVGQVEIYFRVYDDDTWDDIFETDAVTIKTSAYSDMDTTPNDTGTELYNEGGIRIVGKTVDENSFWGTAILLYIENNTDKNVGINVDDMSINGFMMTPYFSTTVYAGKMAIDDITILSSELEENGIDSIDEVALKFHIYNSDTYDTIKDSDEITFSAQ